MNKMVVGIWVANTFHLIVLLRALLATARSKLSASMTEGLNYALSTNQQPHEMIEFLIENWAALLIGLAAFAKVVVNLTPTEKDNMVFGYLDLLINAIVSDRKKAK